MSAVLVLIGVALLLLAIVVSPRDFTKRERRGIVTDCQRDPLRHYGRLRRGRRAPDDEQN